MLMTVAGCNQQQADEPAVDANNLSAAADDQVAVGQPSAAKVFEQRCASCHLDPDNPRAPGLKELAQLGASQIGFAMTNGTMKAQAEGLGLQQIIQLSAHIAGNKPAWQPQPQHFCQSGGIDPQPVVARWALDANSTFAMPAGASSVSSANVQRLRLAWAFGLPDVANARSQPVITANTVFVAATSGHLFALDRVSGCVRWHQSLPAPPRTALTLGQVQGQAALIYGDAERHINARDLLNGQQLWRAEVSVSEHSMLTGAAVQHQQQLIVPVSMYEVGLAADPSYPCCRSHGAVVSLDVDSGKQQWEFHTTAEATEQGLTSVGVQSWGPSGAPVWGTPTVDTERGLIYLGTGQNASAPATELSDAVLALDLKTGRKQWHFQTIAGDVYNVACDQQPPGPNCPRWRGPDHDIGAAIALVKDASGKDRLIVGQKSGDVYALDPDRQGRVIWRQRVGAGSALGGVHWGLAVAGGVIYAPVADPPFPLPNYRPRPGLYALDLEDGDLRWFSEVTRGCETNLYAYFGRSELYPQCSFYFGLSAAPLAVNDLIVAPALDGRVRAFHRDDGRVLWQDSTQRSFETVNGLPAHGGSIDVAGVSAAGDMLFVQSGYGQFGQLPGNVLLAYRLDQL